jgi:superfamily I DNA/RNA helicase
MTLNVDAVEIGRQAAAIAHANAVDAGENPWRPLEFILAEVKRRNLSAEATAKGGAVLNGARACYVPAHSLILYENVGSDFDRAFLIAHELGHIHLGDDVDDAPNTAPYVIDPARAAEASPVGMERVVDYGRRQRREVQMDLFAREFLLPRPWLRQLHVEQAMTATAIASKMGVPFEVVAQQLLDALLLPPITAPLETGDQERPLNVLQKAAAQHSGTPYLLEAGPGTGKTRTLVGRIQHLLEQKVDPRRILVLTFSNKAAGEIGERIACVDRSAAAAMWTGTFHAFGLDIVRRFHTELGLPADPRMLDRTEAVELLENEFPRLGLVHYRNIYDPTNIIADMLSAISRAKDEVVDAEAYEALANAMLKPDLDEECKVVAEKALEVAKVYKAYEELKRNSQAVDFGDLVCLPVQLMERNPAVQATLRDAYDHVLVDEYQDVNRSSVRLLNALCGEGENLWVVGDAKQSIYRFRGASSYNIDRFGREDFPKGKRGRLKKNYRSVDELLEVSSKFAVGMAVGDTDSGLEPDRGKNGHIPQLRRVDLGDDQAVAIADAVADMLSKGVRYRDQAVLCTGQDKLSEFGQRLEQLNIPVLFLGSLFERAEVKDVLALISLLVDRRAMGLLRTACQPEFEMSLDDVACVIDHLRENDVEPGAWRSIVDEVDGLTEPGRESLRQLATALEGFGSDATPWTVIATVLLDRSRMAASLVQSGSVADRSRAIGIWQLMNFLRVQPAGKGLPITRLLERIRRLVRIADDRDLRQLPVAAQSIDAVRLMTIHGAKGLEFNVVHLPGMNVSTLPRSAQNPKCPPPLGMIVGGDGDVVEIHKREHDKEQECLFYVALSRARDRLFMYAATRNALGRSRGLSSFIDRLDNSIEIQPTTLSRPTPTLPAGTPIDLVVEAGLRFPGYAIGLYQSCERRFFYTHLLQVGGKRTQTPFMLMHDAVRKACAEVVEQGEAKEELLEKTLIREFSASGLYEHGYASDYLGLAKEMVGYFTTLRAGQISEKAAALSLTFGEERILVVPDDVLVAPDGNRTFRRVRTGHARDEELKDAGATTFALAARQAFPDAKVEIVFLSDAAVQPIDFTAKQLDTGRSKVAKALGDMRAGIFPAKPSDRVCPGCPAFFVCGQTPPGSLRRSF